MQFSKSFWPPRSPPCTSSLILNQVLNHPFREVPSPVFIDLWWCKWRWPHRYCTDKRTILHGDSSFRFCFWELRSSARPKSSSYFNGSFTLRWWWWIAAATMFGLLNLLTYVVHVRVMIFSITIAVKVSLPKDWHTSVQCSVQSTDGDGDSRKQVLWFWDGFSFCGWNQRGLLLSCAVIAFFERDNVNCPRPSHLANAECYDINEWSGLHDTERIADNTNGGSGGVLTFQR